MARRSGHRSLALALALYGLVWSGYVMVPVERHLSEHAQHAGHTAQHKSLACAWLCAAGAFVYTPEVELAPRFAPIATELFHAPAAAPTRGDLFAFYSRPPPV